MKLCIMANTRVLISNIKIFFSDSTLKHPNKTISASSSKGFFCIKLCSFSNSSVLISNMAIVFQESSSFKNVKIFLFYRKPWTSSKTKLLNKFTKFYCYNRVLHLLYLVNENLVQNNFHISYVYYLFSQSFLYLLKPQSNHQRWEIIFLSR